LFERVDLAGAIMYEVLENSKLSLEKQDQMLQIGIETKEEITGLRKDTGKYLNDEFAEIKKELTAIKGALARAGIQV